MNEQTPKRIEEIEARLQALGENKGNYCAQWSAMHAIQGNAVADLRFLLQLVNGEVVER